MTSSELRERFLESPEHRVFWNQFVASETYKMVTGIIRQSAIEAATCASLDEHDVVAARRGFKFQAVEEVLRDLAVAGHMPSKLPQDPVPWAHIGTETDQ